MKITVENRLEAIVVELILGEIDVREIQTYVLEGSESFTKEEWGRNEPGRDEIKIAFSKFLKAPIYIGDKLHQDVNMTNRTE